MRNTKKGSSSFAANTRESPALVARYDETSTTVGSASCLAVAKMTRSPASNSTSTGRAEGRHAASAPKQIATPARADKAPRAYRPRVWDAPPRAAGRVGEMTDG